MPLEIKPGVDSAKPTPGDCETFGALANTQLRAADGNAARSYRCAESARKSSARGSSATVGGGADDRA